MTLHPLDSNPKLPALRAVDEQSVTFDVRLPVSTEELMELARAARKCGCRNLRPSSHPANLNDYPSSEAVFQHRHDWR